MKQYKPTDSITVLGGTGQMQAMQFNLSDLGKLADMYSKIYSNPHKSILVEYVTNAWEATKAAKSNKPVRVFARTTEQGNVFGIQDFGTGLDSEGIQIFGTYAKSTKQEFEIGGHGIGCKAAFSLVNEFFVNTIKNGKKIQAVFTREEGRVPNMVIMPEVDTDEENGTTVYFHLNEYDITSILSNVKELRYFDNLVFDISSKFGEIDKFSVYHFDKYSLSTNVEYNTIRLESPKFLIGRVLYPIPDDFTIPYSLPLHIHVHPSKVRTLPNREGIDWTTGNVDGKTTKEYLQELIDAAFADYINSVDSLLPEECSFEEWVNLKWDNKSYVYHSDYDISIPHYDPSSVSYKVLPPIINELNQLITKEELIKAKTLYNDKFESTLNLYYLIDVDSNRFINTLYNKYVQYNGYSRELNSTFRSWDYKNFRDEGTAVYVTKKQVSSKKKERFIYNNPNISTVYVLKKQSLDPLINSGIEYYEKIGNLLLTIQNKISDHLFKDFDSVKLPKTKKAKTAKTVRSSEGWYLQKHRLSFNDGADIVIESPEYYKDNSSILQKKIILDATEYTDREITAILNLNRTYVFFSSVINSVRFINTVKLFKNYMSKQELLKSSSLDRDIHLALIEAVLVNMNYQHRNLIGIIGGELERKYKEIKKYTSKYNNALTLSKYQLDQWKKIRNIDYIPHELSRYYYNEILKIKYFFDQLPYKFGKNEKELPLVRLLNYHLKVLPSPEFSSEYKIQQYEQFLSSNR